MTVSGGLPFDRSGLAASPRNVFNTQIVARIGIEWKDYLHAPAIIFAAQGTDGSDDLPGMGNGRHRLALLPYIWGRHDGPSVAASFSFFRNRKARQGSPAKRPYDGQVCMQNGGIRLAHDAQRTVTGVVSRVRKRRGANWRRPPCSKFYKFCMYIYFLSHTRRRDPQTDSTLLLKEYRIDTCLTDT